MFNAGVVTVRLSDVNEAPVFSPGQPTMSILELVDSSGGNTLLGGVVATDEDVDDADALSYSIVEDYGENFPFVILSQSVAGGHQKGERAKRASLDEDENRILSRDESREMATDDYIHTMQPTQFVNPARFARPSLNCASLRSAQVTHLSLVKMDRISSVGYATILCSLFGNVTNLKPLVKIDFGSNKFSHGDVTTFASQIENSSMFPISQLVLDDCNLGIEGVSLIVQSLVERKPGTLKKLSLARNTHIGFFTSATSIHGFQTALSRLIKGSEPIMELNLSGDVGHKLGEGVVSIVEALKSNKTIIKLDVCGHKTGDKLAVCIGEVLKVNKTLAYIQFDKNSTSIEGFKSLLENMKGNKRVINIGPPVRDFTKTARLNKEENQPVLDAIEEVVARNAKETGRRGSLMSGINLEQIEAQRAQKKKEEGRGEEEEEETDEKEMENAVTQANMARQHRYSEAVKKSSVVDDDEDEDEDEEEEEDEDEDEDGGELASEP